MVKNVTAGTPMTSGATAETTSRSGLVQLVLIVEPDPLA